MTSREELEAAIEAILFVATEPVATERLHALFGDDDREAVEAALQAVIARYPGGAAQGLVADFAAGGVRLVTRPALQGYLRKFFQVTGRTKLSMAGARDARHRRLSPADHRARDPGAARRLRPRAC